MDQSLKALPKAEKKKEPVEKEPTYSKRGIKPTSMSWGFRTREVRITKIPNHFQAKKTENILILVAFSIGLGSVWRFPYLCHQNGGGSFLLMYLILLLLVGIPLLYMEMIIGQWLRMDNIRAWRQLAPWLSGLGYSSTLACVLVSLYNSALISWNLLYLGQSFDYPPPWEQCQMHSHDHGNISLTKIQCLRTVPYQYFWYHTTLDASSQVEDGIEMLVLNITLCLFATWVFLYIILIIRIKISVLMLIFSIFFPYVLLLCFLIRSLFLQGAMAGLRRLVTTELSILSSLDTWRQAGGHVLYSLGLGMGTIITFSSYQTRGDNYIKLASFMAMVNLVTSLLSTAIIFLVLGFWSTTSGPRCVEKSVSNLVGLIARGVLSHSAWPPQDIVHKPPREYLDWISQLPSELQKEVVRFSLPCSILVQKEKFMEGPGLAYVAFSQVISLFPGSSFWAIIFFIALVIMGLATLTTLLESIVLPLQTNIPTFAKYPKLIPVTVCLGGLLGSLVFSSRSGSYVVFLFDDHLVPMVLVIIVVLQNLSLAFVYGIRRFRADMFNQLGRLVWAPFTFLWTYVTLPALLVLLTIYFLNLYHRESLYYISWNDSMGQEEKRPYQKTVLGWVTFLSVLALLPIPVNPLQHWWYLDDQDVCEVFKKRSSFRRTEMGSNKVSQWPAYPLRRLTIRSPDKGGQVPLPGKNPTEVFHLQPPNLLTKRDSESYSVSGDAHQASTCPTESRRQVCGNPAGTSVRALTGLSWTRQLRSPSSSSPDAVARVGPGPPDSLRYGYNFGVSRSDTVLSLALPSPFACQLCGRPPRDDDLRCCQDSICGQLINEVVDYIPAVFTVFSLTHFTHTRCVHSVLSHTLHTYPLCSQCSLSHTSHIPAVGTVLSLTHTSHSSLGTWDPSAVWTQVLSSPPMRKLQEALPPSANPISTTMLTPGLSLPHGPRHCSTKKMRHSNHT
ncbi:sodium-dependent neutral amino acid transporter B(0)AT2-like [Arvicola amphibius]|uniref:sodium-dependent neutral amino acid transporter B(0)AT2-like n=1 Tax=Arvicola amphibius TaxID=1047088 RepID=UPI001C09BB71|nr:sodium-dependent neutral amino acid transporter B(0)AT2-like [Arvicola amphibius]